MVDAYPPLNAPTGFRTGRVPVGVSRRYAEEVKDRCDGVAANLRDRAGRLKLEGRRCDIERSMVVKGRGVICETFAGLWEMDDGIGYSVVGFCMSCDFLQ